MKGVDFTVEDIKIFSQLYQEGNSISEIAKKHNICPSSIYKAFKRNKLELIPYRKYRINHNYFEAIDSFEKAYFLGLILADGCITNKNRLQISLQNRDSYILDKLKESIESEVPIYQDKESRVFSISSNKIRDDLAVLGIEPNKTNYAYVPDLPEEYRPHFIRGFFDGDGGVTDFQDHVRLTITGLENVLLKVQDWLMESCDLSKTKLLREHPEKPFEIYRLSYGGNVQAARIYNYLYKNSTVHLERKRIKFLTSPYIK